MTANHVPASRPLLTPFVRRAVLLSILLAAGFYVGTPAADVSWVQGDEYLFIANNPDVTGGEGTYPLAVRLVQIFGKVHGDLYQPLPIAGYAIEWALWGDQAAYYVRVTDLLLHLLNGVLVWCLLSRLLRWQSDSGGTGLLAWALALFWTVHPALVRAYAADMGRTHVLSATFSLLALAWFVRYAEDLRPRDAIAALLALLLAMLSKPVVGWFVVAGLLVWHRHGVMRALRDRAVWAAAVICGAFALVTMRTSRAAGLLENVGEALFGDPVTRSLLAAFLYVRDSVWPVGLPIWYIPDVRTGWDYLPVQVGLVVLLVSLVAIAVLLWRRDGRLLAGGLLWYWVFLLPVLGIVGARFSSAGDRYLYQPLVGLLLAVGVLVLRVLPQVRLRNAVAVLGVIGAATLVPQAAEFAAVARSMIARGTDVITRYPVDPRAFEMHGAAYSFLVDHPEAGGPDGAPSEYAAVAISSLERAAELAEDERFFRTPRTQADFFWRLSENLQKLSADEASQSAARRAFDLYPEDAAICTRYAHASRIVQDWPEALRAYQVLGEHLPEDETLRVKRLTEHADLLLHVFEDPVRARPIYERAREVGAVPDRALVGLARCEVLVGEGARGFELAREVADRSPERSDALLVIALFHLRSNHISEAARAYGRVLARWPTNYEGLRGFQEVATQTGRYGDAVMAWKLALEREPARQAFRSYYAWSLALAGDAEAVRIAELNLQVRPDDPFSCFAQMLVEWRAGRREAALDWCRRGVSGEGQPRAREVVRVELAVRLLQERGQLDREADRLRAVLLRGQGKESQAEALLAGLDGE